MIAGTMYIASHETKLIDFSCWSEPSFRRKGLAFEALQLMLGYATGQPQAFPADTSADSSQLAGSTASTPIHHHRYHFDDSPLRISPSCLLTRISDTNTPSIRLFEKLGFTITKRVEVFREVEMRYRRPLLLGQLTSGIEMIRNWHDDYREREKKRKKDDEWSASHLDLNFHWKLESWKL